MQNLHQKQAWASRPPDKASQVLHQTLMCTCAQLSAQ